MATVSAPGYQQFLAQRQRLALSLQTARVNSTAARFNRLDETSKKALFILANDAASGVPGMSPLTRSHLNLTYEDLGDSERACLMFGIKRLAAFATSLPWEFEDIVAPRAEIQALRDRPPTPDSETN